LRKASQTYQEWIERYPRDYGAHLNLGTVYAEQTQFERATRAYRESLRLAPDFGAPYSNLVTSLLSSQRFEEARQTIQQAQARKLDDAVLHIGVYALGFLTGDRRAMAEQMAWFRGKPD
jgi:Flp pilus assembly protein TadD